jgi:catechol 2,3-dioxygenase-like lactoylglutathione lyase family enzyme
MLQIKRAGHSTLTTPDIERAIDYFTRIVGLSLAARQKNRAILATKSGLEAIVLEHGGAVDAPRLSFQVAPGSDLGEVASRLKKAGMKSEWRSDITPGIGEAVAFTDPKGTTLEIFSDFKFAPEDNTFTGVMPIKFGHIAYQCPDVQSVVKFYCDMLGFRVSDWRGDFFAFLRCSRDHHTVNSSATPRLQFITLHSRCAIGPISSAPAICWRATTSCSLGGRSATSSAITSRSIIRTPTA